jgi:hypothetical protein
MGPVTFVTRAAGVMAVFLPLDLTNSRPMRLASSARLSGR